MLNTKLRTYRSTNAGMARQVAELEDALRDKEAHQAVANALTEEHEFGITNFMHTDFFLLAGNDAERDEAFRKWVRTFGAWPFTPFHKFYHWSNAKSLLKFRLDRLANVATVAHCTILLMMAKRTNDHHLAIRHHSGRLRAALAGSSSLTGRCVSNAR